MNQSLTVPENGPVSPTGRWISAHPHRLIGAVSFLFFLLYVGLSSENYLYADDSFPFATHVFSGPKIIVHHLVLVPLHWLNQFLGFTEPSDLGKSIAMFKLYVAGSAWLALWLVGSLSYRWFSSLPVAVVSMLFTGFTYGFWSYSIVTDIYVPAVAFVLLAVLLAERSYEGATSRARYGWLGASAVAVLLASLNHQSHSLVVAPITLVLLWYRKDLLSWNDRLARAAFFFALTGALGFGVFYAAYLSDGTGHGFFTFIRGYAAWMKLMPYDELQWLTPAYVAIGFSRAFLFPDYMVHFDSIYARVHDHFPLKLLMKGKYLVRDLPDPMAIALMAMSAVLLALLLAAMILAVRRARRQLPASAGFRMIACWMLVQGLFFAWWLPLSQEFWLWIMPCLGLIVPGLVLRGKARGVRRPLSWLFVAGLCAVNAPAIVKYTSADNCIYRANQVYLEQLTEQDLVISPYMYPISWFTKLLQVRAPVHLCRNGAFAFSDATLKTKLDRVATSNGRVFLDPVLVSPDDTEIHRLSYYAHVSRGDVEKELLKLEQYCKESHLPLVAVKRKGGNVIQFRPCPFRGHVQWTSGTKIEPGK